MATFQKRPKIVLASPDQSNKVNSKITQTKKLTISSSNNENKCLSSFGNTFLIEAVRILIFSRSLKQIENLAKPHHIIQ
jgi:hypothetical protein